jgi:hypothetical protein
MIVSIVFCHYTNKKEFNNINNDQLSSLLIRINVKDVLENFELSYCDNITGIGPEPIRGSTILCRLIMRYGISCPDPTLDAESLVRTIESLFLSSTTSDSAPSTSFPGLIHLVLPVHVGREEDATKLQKLF